MTSPNPDLFSSLGHQTRTEIVAALGEFSPANLSFLAARLKKSVGHVSHHAQILVRSGLLDRQVVGSWASFSINQSHLRDMILFLGSVIKKEAPKDETQPNVPQNPSA